MSNAAVIVLLSSANNSWEIGVSSEWNVTPQPTVAFVHKMLERGSRDPDPICLDTPLIERHPLAILRGVSWTILTSLYYKGQYFRSSPISRGSQPRPCLAPGKPERRASMIDPMVQDVLYDKMIAARLENAKMVPSQGLVLSSVSRFSPR